jgi:hypothetical protein
MTTVATAGSWAHLVAAQTALADRMALVATVASAQAVLLQHTDPADRDLLPTVCRAINPVIGAADVAVMNLADAHVQWSEKGAPRGTVPGRERRMPPLSADTLPRLFLLDRSNDHSGQSGIGIVAYGVELPEVPPPGPRVVTVWRGIDSGVWNLSAWQSVQHVERIHGHGGDSHVRWLYRPPLAAL